MNNTLTFREALLLVEVETPNLRKAYLAMLAKIDMPYWQSLFPYLEKVNKPLKDALEALLVKSQHDKINEIIRKSPWKSTYKHEVGPVISGINAKTSDRNFAFYAKNNKWKVFILKGANSKDINQSAWVDSQSKDIPTEVLKSALIEIAAQHAGALHGQ